MGTITYNISLTKSKLKDEAPEGAQVQHLAVNPVSWPKAPGPTTYAHFSFTVTAN